MNRPTKQLFMVAAIAGILGGCGKEVPSGRDTHALADKSVGTCTEKNGCSGKGNCAGKAAGKEHDCAGKNACSNNQVYNITKEKCDGYKGDWQPNP